ncbi:MAG: arginine repressor [Candidatus Latescibacteria bacterium]|jgi:transcriptional regulator of arginine metabolism|nr:arginine repressor [Candidatus Latescibacterota bacterium]
MRSKKQRQKHILRIMEGRHFHTQQEVAVALHESGFDVSQSTLSKDFKELKMVKTTAPDGSFKYVLPQFLDREIRAGSLHREIEDFATNVALAGQLVVMKTESGNASGVCETVDQAGWSEVVGTIAGDNTILLICQTDEAARRLAERIRGIMNGR